MESSGSILSPELKDFILKGNKEFDSKEGKVTIEFSIEKDKLIDFLSFVRDNSPELGNWIVYECEICREQHGENYCHAEILPYFAR